MRRAIDFASLTIAATASIVAVLEGIQEQEALWFVVASLFAASALRAFKRILEVS